MRRRVGCAVLAAGSSRRLGAAKQLLPFEGVPLVRRAANTALRSRAAATLVVLGAKADAVRGALDGASVELRVNPRFGEGLASSVRVAAEWAFERTFDALLITLCDQPLLTHRHLDALVDLYQRTGMVVASRYAGRCAVPALFPARRLAELLALRGDRGARALLRAERPIAVVPWPEGELDVDTRAQAERMAAARALDRAASRREEVS